MVSGLWQLNLSSLPVPRLATYISQETEAEYIGSWASRNACPCKLPGHAQTKRGGLMCCVAGLPEVLPISGGCCRLVLHHFLGGSKYPKPKTHHGLWNLLLAHLRTWTSKVPVPKRTTCPRRGAGEQTTVEEA